MLSIKGHILINVWGPNTWNLLRVSKLLSPPLPVCPTSLIWHKSKYSIIFPYLRCNANMESHWQVLQGGPGGKESRAHQLGFLRDQFLDHSSSPYTLHHWVPLYKHMVSLTIAILMTHNSIFHFDQMIQR